MCDSSSLLKVCSYCDESLPATVEVFGKDKNMKDGLNRYCKACRRYFAKYGYECRKRPPAPDGMKVCSYCRECLPATPDFFHAHSSGGYGLRAVCKKCRPQEGELERKSAKARAKKTPESLVCSACRQRKPTEAFGVSAVSATGRKGACKECRNALHRLMYQADLRSQRERDRQKRERYKAQGRRIWHERYWRNPEAARARSRHMAKIRYARKRQAPGSFTDAAFQQKCAAYDWRCHWCGCKIEGRPEADHLIAVTRGGANTIGNIVPSCMPCNRSKYNKLPHEWTGRLL